MLPSFKNISWSPSGIYEGHFIMYLWNMVLPRQLKDAGWSIVNCRSSTLNTYFPLLSLPYSGAGGWSPSDSDHYQWLQVDFGNRKQISAIATQGRYSSSDWVTQYRMLYSDTGRNWKPYHQDGNIWVSHCQKRKDVELSCRYLKMVADSRVS